MRPSRRWSLTMTAMFAVSVIACSGDDSEPTEPGGGGNTGGSTVTLSAAEKSAVAASLSALATRVGANDVSVRQFINALAFAVQQATTATDVDVATNLDVLGDDPGVAARGASLLIEVPVFEERVHEQQHVRQAALAIGDADAISECFAL